MLKTHLKPALRNFRKYPVFSSINLAGLSIGMAASFILLVYSQREMNCDRHFQDADRIVRIGTDFFSMGGFAKSQSLIKDLLTASCKDVQYATSFDRSGTEISVRTSEKDRAFTDIYPYYIDPVFFSVFSYRVSAGTIPPDGLSPGETILSESYAKRFFSGADPIGRTILVGKENSPFTVVAVLKEGFEKSHLDPQVLLPLAHDQAAPDKVAADKAAPDKVTRKDGMISPINWSSASVYNYVKLKENGSVTGLKSWLDRLVEKGIYPASGAVTSFAQWKDGNTAIKFFVQPLTDIYFHSDLKFELSPGGNITQVRLLSTISIFLILLAVINYVNLVTARSSIRSREIGIKKVFGASRSDLVTQVLLESILFSFLAMFLACGLIQVILFIYQSATGSQLTGPFPLLKAHYAWLILFSLFVGTLAGIYPAFYLTAFKPLLSIRPFAGLPGKNNFPIRNMLVLVQFTIAAALIFVSFVVYGQLQYMKNKDKGFRGEGVVIIENAGSLNQRAFRFQHQLEQQSQVVSTSFCNRTPAGNSIWMYTYRTPSMKEDITLQTFPVDDKYIATLGMRLTNGRNFNKDLITDTNALILNESAVAVLGLFDPVGTTINGDQRVIGVVKDFNFASLREKIGPVVLRFAPQGNALAIKVRGGQISAFLDMLNNLGKELMPEEPLKISFLDDNFAKLARKEKLMGNAIGFFTLLAIFLATLGLTGLTLFTIEKRTKEIGIRKVLGANPSDLLGLVSGDFIRLAAIASLIAFPLSWWLVHHWLENFAYRISVSIWSFFLTESILVIIAFFVISLLTLGTALAGPAKSLRTE